MVLTNDDEATRAAGDDLDDMIAVREERSPGYSERVDEALARRRVAEKFGALGAKAFAAAQTIEELKRLAPDDDVRRWCEETIASLLAIAELGRKTP